MLEDIRLKNQKMIQTGRKHRKHRKNIKHRKLFDMKTKKKYKKLLSMNIKSKKKIHI